jgi:hypothetical protein
MKKMQQKNKRIQIYKIEYSPPQNNPKGWQTPSSKLKRAATTIQCFSMAKYHTPLETKANQTKRQTQPNTPTLRKEAKREA